MSDYPTMDQYNDTVQHPQTAFADVSLKSAKIATNGMGLPIALGGGFALTYTATAQGRKFAVRCFHKEAKGLGVRYARIDEGLRAASALYFVGFEYQPAGILVNGKHFPIVKMDWAEGDTLGSFLEDNFSDKNRIERLRSQFNDLERFLRSKRIAHGDLQNGNVVVKSDLTLIDYDGMYVPSIPIGQGAELGHKHFQHPGRSATDFGPEIDRFSFIVIDLSLRAIAHSPKLFSKYSNGENIIFTASDFANPGNSAIFSDLRKVPTLARDTMSLASICAGPMKGIPALEDFLRGKNIPAAAISIRTSAEKQKESVYIGAYDVVDATSYDLFAKHIGNRVELVGKVAKVHFAKTKYGKSYCFIFFNESRQTVKLNIWSEGLVKLPTPPSPAWVGTWLSVQGLVDPAYSGRYGTSLSITITSSSQLRRITEVEAKHRLNTRSSGRVKAMNNRAILEGGGAEPQQGRSQVQRQTPNANATPKSRNQAILDTIHQAQGSWPQPTWKNAPSQSPVPLYRSRAPRGEVPWAWLIFGAVVLFILLGALS